MSRAHSSLAEIHTLRPVSGLVSAIEPTIRGTGGTWIAQSCGNADLEVLRVQGNENGDIPAPAGDYGLRRVFLSRHETEGHTDGFSNRGLWPLFHLAYQKPQFVRRHWECYQRVNARFAEAVTADELASPADILIQDYHLALVPGLLRKRISGSPAPSVALFWHIPWPPAELLTRCPWIREILEGMLGADLIGFHTPEHCENFLQSCVRILGAQLDPTSGTVLYRGRRVRVRAIPVGIDPRPFEVLPWSSRAPFWRDRHGIVADRVLLAVDRIDPTKGILERLDAYELLLEARPDLRRKITLVQVAPPCRQGIEDYRLLHRQVKDRFQAIQLRWGGPGHVAAHLMDTAQDWASLAALYQMADLCLVSPLHDGMNLVAKEYAWCQHHLQGGLLLSRFAGASLELATGSSPGAWLVNPSDPDGFAETLGAALNATPDEREARMHHLRDRTLLRTATHWGNELLQELKQAC